MVIIGIDTDAKGSVAILDARNPEHPLLDIYAIPNRYKVLRSGTKRLEVDYPALAAIMIGLISSVDVTRAYLEDQWSRPNQDSGATFTFGKTFGDCRSATAAGFLVTGMNPAAVYEKIVYVPGEEWKASMRLSSDKELSLTLASKLFPSCAQAWKLKSKHTSAAEAALLALFGASKEGLKLPRNAIVTPPKKPILTFAHSLVLG